MWNATGNALAYKYTSFCVKYREFARTQARSMRQIHIAGEKLFVDYAGSTVPIIDASTGEITQAQIFVATLGASNCTYRCAILAARPAHPRDKPKVEVSVLLVQRWILARLRNRRFFTLHELNQAIGLLLVDLNQRPFKKLPGCRRSAFEQLDAPALRTLPVITPTHPFLIEIFP